MSEAVERSIVLPAPASEVWAALARPERMSDWFGARVEFELRLGARFTFTWPDGTIRGAVVEALEAERLLVLRWLPYERTPDGATRGRPAGAVRFVLRKEPGGTRLTVLERTEAGVEVVPPLFVAPYGGSHPPSGPVMARVRG